MISTMDQCLVENLSSVRKIAQFQFLFLSKRIAKPGGKSSTEEEKAHDI